MSEGMNQWLAQCYNTPGAATEEDLQKVAEAELFAKLAHEQGFDLNAMTDAQVADLWNKVAQEDEGSEADKKEDEAKAESKGNGNGAPPFPPKKEEKSDEEAEKEEKEAAAQEWAMQKAAADQIGFMDYCGRVMAHAYVNELTKIGQAMASEGLPEAGAAAATASAPSDVNERISKLASAAPQAASPVQPTNSERLDYLAAKEAVKMAAEAGVDPHFAAERLNAVLTLGPNESVKIASAESVDQALHIRGLELLEQAGFEVTWNE